MAATEREIRFALAMNGGVSLAVWIGGVADEFLRLLNETEDVDLTASQPCPSWSPYALAAWAAAARPKVDVVAGASAGGLNGVFLSLGIVHRMSNLASLRDLWIDAGGFDELLRDPLSGHQPSLMKGDEYFLVKLNEAIRTMLPTEPSTYARSVHAMLTATSMSGHQPRFDVGVGGELSERRHDVLLSFRHSPGAEPAHSDFAVIERPAEAAESYDRERLIARLARACRSTASFPGAFEPSRVLVRERGDDVTDDPADTFLDVHNENVGPDFLIDGGTLVNLPVREALTAIFNQRANDAVRRVFVMIVPDPSDIPQAPENATGPEPDDAPPSDGKQVKLPGVVSVVGGALTTIPRNQTIGDALRELGEANDNLDNLLAARRAFIDSGFEKMLPVARGMFGAYQARRRSATKQVLRSHLDAYLARKGVAHGERPAWRQAVENIEPPWLPSSMEPEHFGEWGRTTVRRSAARLLTEIRFLEENQTVVPPEIRATINGVLEAAGEMAMRQTSNHFESLRLDTTPEVAVAELLQHWIDARVNVEEMLEMLGSALCSLLPLRATPPPLMTLVDSVRYLLCLEVVEQPFGGFGHLVEQKAEVHRLDGVSISPLDALDRNRPNGKVAGVQLGHFGSFFKAAWRANDWMWGRLDGSNDLIRIMLQEASPERKRDLAEALDVDQSKLTETLVERLHVDIVLDEARPLKVATQTDRESGDRRLSSTSNFVNVVSHYERADEDKKTPLGPKARCEHASAILRANRIGAEAISDHSGSDLLSRVASTTLATGASVLHRSSPSILKAPISLVRWAALVLWGFVKGSVGGVTTRTIAGIALGFGAAIVSIHLFAGTDLGVVYTIGLLLLLAGVALGMARVPLLASTFVLIGVLPLLAARLPAEAVGWWPEGWKWPSLRDTVDGRDVERWPFLPPLAFVAAALAIGTIRAPGVQSRLQSDESRAHRRLRALASTIGGGRSWAWVAGWVVGLVIGARSVLILAGVEWSDRFGDFTSSTLGAVGLTLFLVLAMWQRRAEAPPPAPAEAQAADAEPGGTEPAAPQAADAGPAATQPAEAQAADPEPAASDPAVVDPGDAEPAATQPVVVDPGAAGRVARVRSWVEAQVRRLAAGCRRKGVLVRGFGVLPLFRFSDGGWARPARLAQAILAMAAGLLVLPVVTSDSRAVRWWCVGAVMVCLGVLVTVDAVRRHRFARVPTGPAPDRALVWSVGPMAAMLVVAALAIGVGSHDELSVRMFLQVIARAAAFEFLFRGALLLLAVRLFSVARAHLVVAVTFAVWYLPSIWTSSDHLAADSQRAAYVIIGFVAFAVGGVLLAGVRLRSRSLLGSIALHATAAAAVIVTFAHQ